MKCTVLCFVFIGLCSGIPLVLGEIFEYECDILQRLDYLETKDKDNTQKIAALENKDKETNQLLLSLDNELKTAKEVIATLESKSTEKLQGQAVGFTMKHPVTSPTSRQLTFSTTVSNVGGGYNVTTGVFTCSIPGYYYFSVSLLKDYSYEGSAYCKIYKNNVYLVAAYTGPGHTPRYGVYAAVNSVYTHLEAGDNVTLAGCSQIVAISTSSSFSGFLVTPDVI